MEEPPRKKLKIVEPAIVSLLVWGIYRFLVPAFVCDLGHARDGATSALINLLNDAVEAYHLDFGVYPPGVGDGTKDLVPELSKSGPKKQKYFEIQPDMLSDGHVINPVHPDTAIIYYRCPGRFRPGSFDLWTEDRRGDPMGIHNR